MWHVKHFPTSPQEVVWSTQKEQEFVRWVQNYRAGTKTGVLLMYGPTGSAKVSSIPALLSDDPSVQVAVMDQGLHDAQEIRAF
jgi:type II secretory ATPase GspE/PulE/Tfp pilus assembly ATPase PilB-like protein